MIQCLLKRARRRQTGLLLATVSLAAGLLAWNQPSALAADEPSDREVFRTRVALFLKQHCVKCHGPETQKGKLTLHTIDGDVPGGKDLNTWKAVAERLALNEMPPETEPRPDAKTLASVRAWIKEQLAKGGASTADVEAKLLLPGHGNRVDHGTLFSGTITGP